MFIRMLLLPDLWLYSMLPLSLCAYVFTCLTVCACTALVFLAAFAPFSRSQITNLKTNINMLFFEKSKELANVIRKLHSRTSFPGKVVPWIHCLICI